jgi:hypothetical protein
MQFKYPKRVCKPLLQLTAAAEHPCALMSWLCLLTATFSADPLLYLPDCTGSFCKQPVEEIDSINIQELCLLQVNFIADPLP